MKLGIIVVFAVICAVFLDGSCATPAVEAKPPSLGNDELVQKASNGSVIVQPSNRVRREACNHQERWPHKCKYDCECARHRYCSSYGYCHERNRTGRKIDEYAYDEE